MAYPLPSVEAGAGRMVIRYYTNIYSILAGIIGQEADITGECEASGCILAIDPLAKSSILDHDEHSKAY